MPFTNSSQPGLTSDRLRCKVGEDITKCKERLKAAGWDIPANVSTTEDRGGTILTLPE